MEIIRIQGGHRLSGKVQIRGAKNAALPLMVSAMLTEEDLILDNLPYLADIQTMTALLNSHGVQVNRSKPSSADDRRVSLNAERISNTTAEYDL